MINVGQDSQELPSLSEKLQHIPGMKQLLGTTEIWKDKKQETLGHGIQIRFGEAATFLIDGSLLERCCSSSTQQANVQYLEQINCKEFLQNNNGCDNQYQKQVISDNNNNNNTNRTFYFYSTLHEFFIYIIQIYKMCVSKLLKPQSPITHSMCTCWFACKACKPACEHRMSNVSM